MLVTLSYKGAPLDCHLCREPASIVSAASGSLVITLENGNTEVCELSNIGNLIITNGEAEEAAKIIDELLVFYELWSHRTISMDNSIIRDALNYIAEARRKNPNHPIERALLS